MKNKSQMFTIFGLLLLLSGLYGCSCQPQDDVVTCGDGTQKQDTGSGFECVPDEKPKPTCGIGTHEQGTGPELECVPDDPPLSCGEGTHEQGIGPELEQGAGPELECVPDE